VALAEAVTSSRVRVLLVEEPLLAMDPRAAALVPERLRARGADGWTVVVLTASSHDAGAIADDHAVLRRGAITARATAIEALSGASPLGARVRVAAHDSNDARALVAALARAADVEAVALDGACVVARGPDALALARSVGRSIVDAGLDVAELRVDPVLEGETSSPGATT